MRSLVAAVVLLAALPAGAQTQGPAFDAQGLPLAEALRRAAALAGVALSYDPALTAGQTSTCRTAAAAVDALFACVLGAAPLQLVATGPRSYTLRRRPAPAPPPPPRTGAVVGIVLDDETGRGVPDALVSAGDFGTATTSSGQFTLTGLPQGRYRLRVSHVGYGPSGAAVTVGGGGTEAVRLLLRPRAQELAPLVIDGLSTLRRYERLGIDEAMSQEDTPAPPPYAGWPSTPAEALADYRVQGVPEGEYVLLLDGAPLYAPRSLLGEIGPLSPLAIGRVTVHKAGFGVAGGSNLSGIVEAAHALGRAPELTVRFTPLSFGMRAMGTVAPRRRALVAVRSGLPDIGGLDRVTFTAAQRARPDPLLRALLGPDSLGTPGTWGPAQAASSFTDMHAAYQHQGRGLSLLSASGYYGQRRLSTEFPAAATPAGSDRDRRLWHTFTAQAQWTAPVRGTTLGLVRAWLAGADQQHDVRIAGPAEAVSFAERNRLLEAAVEGRIDAALAPGVRAEGGVAYAYTRSRIDAAALTGGTAALASAQPRASAFATLRLSPIPRVQAELGGRLTYVAGAQRLVGDPHLMLRADGPASPLGPWAVRVAGGLYHQFVLSALTPDLSPAAAFGTSRTWIVPDSTTVVPAAEQYAVEARVEPWPWLAVQGEAFYRSQLRSLVYTPPVRAGSAGGVSAFTQHTPLVSSGTGVTVEVTRPRFTASGRYYRLRERRAWPFLPSDLGAPPGSRPSSGSLALALRPSPRVELTATLHASSGERWAYRLGYYAAAEAARTGMLAPDRAERVSGAAAGIDLATPNTFLGPHVRLDLGVGYRRAVGPFGAVAHLRVLNALARANPDERALQQGSTGPVVFDRQTLPLTLGASLRLTLQAPER